MSEGMSWVNVRAYHSAIDCARYFIATGELDVAAVVLEECGRDMAAELAAAGELRPEHWGAELEERLRGDR